MAETTVLRSKASSGYVRNAPQFGNAAIPGHSALQGGGDRHGNVLPVVHNAPQAGTNARVAGTLPVVQVNMTAGGPQVTNPHQAQPPPPRSTVGKSQSNAGGLPVVQVRMTAAGPQVQSGARASDHGATAQQWSRATADRQAQQFIAPYTMPMPNTAALSTETIVIPSLSSDQLLFFRHLAENYLTGGADLSPENKQLAESTIETIDTIAAMTAAADTIAATESAPVQVQVPVPQQPRHRMVVPQRTVVASNRSAQVTAAATPRRVPRPAHAQPPAAVQPVVAQGRIIDVAVTGEMPPDLSEMTAAHIDSSP